LRNSIQRRLIATVVAAQLLLAVGLLLTGVYYTHRRLLATLDASLQARAISLAALVRYSENTPPRLIFDKSLVPASIDPHHPDLYEVVVEGNGVLARVPGWPGDLSNNGELGYSNLKVHDVHYRVLYLSHLPVLDREENQPPAFLEIVYAAPTHQMREQVRAAGMYIALASLILLAATVLLALWGIRRGLLPLQHLVAQASRVSAQYWEFHPPSEAQQVLELEPLTQAMTTMLDRLHHSFVEQREFLGNAAHELKTPVAVLKSTLQSLLQKPRTSEEYRAGLDRSLEDLERLEQLLQWMLRLARAEQWAQGALRRDLELVDLSETCQGAIERLRGLAQSHHTNISFACDGPVLLRADPEDLQLVWVNLLENAVRYSPEGASVEVSVSRKNGGPARVVFQDHGDGIPPEELPRIFERFHRGEPSRARVTGGFGLGLAIAKALVDAYGGTITAASSPGQGTRITVELPVSTP
jgi:signal transduction histidine kinase